MFEYLNSVAEPLSVLLVCSFLHLYLALGNKGLQAADTAHYAGRFILAERYALKGKKDVLQGDCLYVDGLYYSW